MAYEPTEILAELIRRKHRCLVQLRDLGQRQMQFIAGDEMTNLLDLLAVKQRTLTQLQQIDSAIEPFRKEDPQRRKWRSQEERLACAQLIKECEQLLADIVRQDKESERQLVLRRDETDRQLKGTHIASMARHAYGHDATPGLSQINLISEK
jgi:hypothetical protein